MPNPSLEHDTLESPGAPKISAHQMPKRRAPKPRLAGDGRLEEAREARRERRAKADPRPRGPRYQDLHESPERIPDPDREPWCVWDNDEIWEEA